MNVKINKYFNMSGAFFAKKVALTINGTTYL
jgi:hypothetical protein